MKTHKQKAFTLVELIIVIAILTVLSTIAFISFQNYISNSRDTNRITALTNIETWLEIYKTKTWKYPTPDSAINIELSWSIISYQWEIWEETTKLINLKAKIPLDPLEDTTYKYATTKKEMDIK